MTLFKANVENFLNDELDILKLSLTGVFFDIFNTAIKEGKRIAFVCIGTQRVKFDSFGPIIGTSIRDYLNFMPKMRVYGTLHDNINALNALAKIHQIKDIEQDSLIVAIDAMACRSINSIGDIRVFKGGIKPAAGTNKQLGCIGDYGITLASCLAKNIGNGKCEIDEKIVIDEDNMLIAANIIMESLDEAFNLVIDKHGIERLECINNRYYQY